MEKLRAVTFYRDYFDKFFSKQSKKVKEKIIWTIELIETQRKIPEVYFKHIEKTKGIYEIRIQQGSNIYRIFCFFDDGQLIILMNGFQKKTQKTPKQEIELDLKIKEQYESEK